MALFLGLEARGCKNAAKNLKVPGFVFGSLTVSRSCADFAIPASQSPGYGKPGPVKPGAQKRYLPKQSLLSPISSGLGVLAWRLARRVIGEKKRLEIG